MKKIICALTAIAFVSSLCFVQLPLAMADEVKIFIGKIESVRPMLGKPPKWTYAKATVVSDSGEKTDIYFIGATAITDIDGRSINGSAPKKGKKVEVKYSTAENGRNETISIRYVPLDYVQESAVPTAPGKVVSETVPQLKDTLIGHVENITAIAPGLINGWTYCKVTIITDTGEKPTVFVTINTKLTDAKGITNPPLPKEGERVEIKYSTTEKGVFEATSIRYLPSQQPTALTAPGKAALQPIAKADGAKTLIGKIIDVAPVLFVHGPRWTFCSIVVVSDNGNKSRIFIPRATTITDLNGKDINRRWSGKGERKIGERVEVKYLILKASGNDRNYAVSIRYIPPDYVQQQAAATTPTQAIAGATTQSGNTFTGKVESVRPMLGKPPKWTYAKFTAVADNGEKVDIYMLKATAITDVDGKAINGSAPKKDKKVEIKYSTAENGRNEAISIHYLD